MVTFLISNTKILPSSLQRLQRIAAVTGELQYRLLDRLLAAEEERLAKARKEQQ